MSKNSNTEEKPLLRMLLAGISSLAAQTVTHPIETIKARLQISGEKGRVTKGEYKSVLGTAKSILKNEGVVNGLYKGIKAAYAREMVYSSLRLGLYEPFKKLFGAEAHDTPIWKKFISASSAGLIAAACANPIDFMKIRMQTWEGVSYSLTWHIKQVYNDSGILGFYRGVQITMFRAMLINGTKLSTYDTIKNAFKKRGFHDGVSLQFLCSFTAGLFMALAVAPFDLSRTRVFSQDPKHPQYKGLYDCLRQTVVNEGFKGLYKGFFPLWYRFGPFTVIQLVTWEQLRKMCGIKHL